MKPQDRIAELDWWHTIEVAPGVVTPGGWDLRETAAAMPWPASLAGLRCLDIGTMDGFWAFELERRGASEVLAIDVLDASRLEQEQVPPADPSHCVETVSLPLELLPSPLARLDARRDGSEWFVFNRRGLRKALELSGWVVEETTGVLRDRPGPASGPRQLALAARACHALGVRGRSAAVRARPLTL